MARKSSLVAIVVIALALLYSASAIAAQGPLPVPAVSPPQPDSAGSKGAPAQAAATTFSRFFFEDPIESTYWWTSHTVVDASGGVHITLYDNAFIYYAYCAADCGDTTKWQGTAVAAAGDNASLAFPTLALDPSGHPRLAWYAKHGADTNYHYAECTTNCAASASNWTQVTLAGLFTNGGYPESKRYFALDAQGRPGLVCAMADYNDDGFYYGFDYATCDSGCTTAANWHSTQVVTPDLRPDGLQLVYGPNGRPRVLGYDSNASSLVYAQCDSNCAQAANWGSAALVDLGYNLSVFNYALRVDSQGRPRIAYVRTDADDRVPSYAWSNAAPLTPAGWNSYMLDYPANPEEWAVDLALDSHNRPHLTFATLDFDLSHLTCTANCESTTPSWQQELVETDASLDADYPIETWPDRVSSTWLVMGYPSMALDAADNLSVSYYARHVQVDSGGGEDQDARGMRFATAGDGGSVPPPTGTPPTATPPAHYAHDTYLPAMIR